jgi:hypothetical protein
MEPAAARTSLAVGGTAASRTDDECVALVRPRLHASFYRPAAPGLVIHDPLDRHRTASLII